MAMTNEELDQQLRVVGDRLSDPPSDVDELIALLDKIENLLSKVEQSPKGPLNVSTSVVLEALVADKIFRNSDADAQVAIVSCLCQIIRITAPDAPYNDAEMKELLQLMVSTFAKLDDKSSRSYDKRIAILESTARVRSSVVMLDLECDELIIEMFNHFFRTLRDYHPEGVLSSMRSIITLVLEESEDISPPLLFPILACLRQDNKGALPIAQKLAENVLAKCAVKVKPYLVKAVEVLGASLDNYSPVVVSMCRDKCGDVEHAQVPTNEEFIDKVVLAETTLADADILNDKSPKSEISNDVTQAGKDKILVESGSTESKEDAGKSDVPKDADGLSNAETNSLGVERTELEKTSLAAGDELPVEEDHRKDMLGSTNENPGAETAVASGNGKETNTEAKQDASPVKEAKRYVSPVKEAKQVVFPVKEAKQSADDNSETSELEITSVTLGDAGEKEKDATPQKRLRKTVDRYIDSGSLRLRKKLSRRRASRGSNSARNDRKKIVTSPKSTAEVSEDERESEATPKTSSKRKRTPAKEKATNSSGKDKKQNAEQYGENLVGSRIRVWWPLDEKFYQGIVESYESSRRKHRVQYDDGEKEFLYLRKEKWELVEDNATADEKEADGENSSEATPEPPEKKVKTNGKESSKKEKKSDKKSSKKGKASSSAKSKSKTKSGKEAKDAEKKAEKATEDEKKVVKSKESNSKSKGKSSNIGGKIVAAASRLTVKSFEEKKSKPSSSNGKHEDASSSDDDSEPLVSLLKKSPAAMKNLKAKLKAKAAREGSSGTKRKR